VEIQQAAHKRFVVPGGAGEGAAKTAGQRSDKQLKGLLSGGFFAASDSNGTCQSLKNTLAESVCYSGRCRL